MKNTAMQQRVAAAPGWPLRYRIIGLCVLSALISFMDRVSVSVAIIPMAADFGWDHATSGMVLSAFFVGYVSTQVVGGWLAYRHGTRIVLGCAVLLWSLFTFLTPLAAGLSLFALLAVRIGMGAGEGVGFPAAYHLFAHWVPAQERTRAVTLLGGAVPLGTVIALMLAPWIAANWGWQAIFYTFGGLGLIWFFAWHRAVTDTPKEHPRITAEELSHIREGTVPPAAGEPIPWRLLLSSKANWAIIINSFCHAWGFYVLLAWLPTYFHQVLDIRLADLGPYTMLPYATMAVTTVLGGSFADGLLRKGFSVTFVRKLMQSLGMFGPAFFLILLSGDIRSPLHALVLLCCTLGVTALAYAGYCANQLDIGPRYAGVLLGISNTASQIPGIIGVALTGFIVDATGSWSSVFLIAAGVYVVGGVVWLLMATGERVFE
ncbi:MAG: MFS transporter [Gammaproteobacteria bacterium]|nr:MAG: MFS transporter [Gammaproteobacteria bacterium]